MHDAHRVEPREQEYKHASTGLPVIVSRRRVLLRLQIAVACRAKLKGRYATPYDVRALPVEQVDTIVGADPHVRWRDVAMDDPSDVGGAQAPHKLGRVVEQPPSRLRSHAQP